MDRIPDIDFYNAFKKIATITRPTTFSELKDYVRATFKDNELAMKKFSAWENKLKLDRYELKQIFGK